MFEKEAEEYTDRHVIPKNRWFIYLEADMEVFILRARDYKNEDYQGFAIKGVFTSSVKAKEARLKEATVANIVWSLECWDVDGNFKYVQFI